MMRLTSARGILAMLDNENQSSKACGLAKLNAVVDTFWYEIANDLIKIEKLYEDEMFSQRFLAALLASKVHFHLQHYAEAIEMALNAGISFDTTSNTLYVQTIKSKAIDMYIELQKYNAEIRDGSSKMPVDERLKILVEKMFEKSVQTGHYKEASGFAFDSHRIDLLEKLLLAVKGEDEKASLLSYCFKSALNFVPNRKYRREILECLVKIYMGLKKPDHINVCQCLIFLEDPERVATILEQLLRQSKQHALIAYQIAFDIYEAATQQFIGSIVKFLLATTSLSVPPSSPLPTDPPAVSNPTPSPSTVTDEISKRLAALIKILSGDETVSLHSQFLIKSNKTDMLILKSMKDVVRTNITHNATVIANSLMHAGTTCDDFLRENLDWVGKAANWAKFTAVASLGVIHRGHENEAMKLLESYLPKENQVGTSGYVEGGGLYALGLIHANHGNQKVIDFLKSQICENVNIKHGACLGLGLAAMGTHNEDVYNELKNCLDSDDAVVGEAAGLAMGLVMLGSQSVEATRDMTNYAAATQHEKTLRGLSVGLSLLNFGRLEESIPLFETLSIDKDPNIRRSAVYTLAMAYCGTSSKDAVRHLLHISVSDVNDDVRRAAAMCLGFVFCKTPEFCIATVSSLTDNFNADVRYGAAMALGIAFSGSAHKEAISLLDPLLKDAVSYVRQGALIAMSMVLMQHNETTSAKIKDFRATLTKIVADKQEDNMTKLGAIIGQGILDAAGRNATISLITRDGHVDAAAAAGLLVFSQYWFWFPLAHFLVLSLRPTCLIALNGDLKMPQIKFHCDTKPSLFAYTPALEEKKEKTTEKVETAILSLTAKQKKKEKEREKESPVEKMSVDEPAQAPGGSKPSTAPTTNSPQTTPTSEIEAEANFYMLDNPARVLKQQLKYVTLKNPRYESLRTVNVGGIVVLDDKEPDTPQQLVELVRGGGVKPAEDERMAPAPEPFEIE